MDLNPSSTTFYRSAIVSILFVSVNYAIWGETLRCRQPLSKCLSGFPGSKVLIDWLVSRFLSNAIPTWSMMTRLIALYTTLRFPLDHKRDLCRRNFHQPLPPSMRFPLLRFSCSKAGSETLASSGAAFVSTYRFSTRWRSTFGSLLSMVFETISKAPNNAGSIFLEFGSSLRVGALCFAKDRKKCSELKFGDTSSRWHFVDRKFSFIGMLYRIRWKGKRAFVDGMVFSKTWF